MKLYESCFDYKLAAEDIVYDGESWTVELENFKVVYTPEADFMEQLSQHNLFLLVCMLDLSDDDYVEKIYEIHSDVE
jgi:hypothetical protein